MKKKLLGWIPTVYLGAVLVYYLPNFLWGSLGLIRPSELNDGKVDADYAIHLIAKFNDQARNLYLLLFVGFIVTIIIKSKLAKSDNSEESISPEVS